jgi:hypothetical protein
MRSEASLIQGFRLFFKEKGSQKFLCVLKRS